jgi:excisionase family DNA binding protein
MEELLEPIYAPTEQAEISAFGKAIESARSYGKITAGGSEIHVPESIFKVLAQVIPLLVSDQAVSIVPVGHLLTTQQAAELLNISRPYLIKLIDQGKIACTKQSDKPGSHRRISFEDLMVYKHKRSLQRRQQLKKLTEMSKELGLYDTEN